MFRNTAETYEDKGPDFKGKPNREWENALSMAEALHSVKRVQKIIEKTVRLLNTMRQV